MKITFQKLLDIDGAVASLYKKNPDLKLGKFGHNYSKFYKNYIKPALAEYQEEIKSIQIDHALVNEKTKALLISTSGRGFEYDKEGLKAVIKAENKFTEEFSNKEFDIEPIQIKDLPVLDEEQVELFTGILI